MDEFDFIVPSRRHCNSSCIKIRRLVIEAPSGKVKGDMKSITGHSVLL